DVDERREHRHTHGGYGADRTANECANKIDVVNHQVEDDSDVRSARVEWREAIALDESWRLDEGKRGADCAVEPLDVPGLHHRTRAARDGEECIGFLE